MSVTPAFFRSAAGHVPLGFGEKNSTKQRTAENPVPSPATAARAWRKANPEKVAAYNERRRHAYQLATAADRVKDCRRCGVEFIAANANVLRCEPCRKAVARDRDAAKKRRRRSREREPAGERAPSKEHTTANPSPDFRETNSKGPDTGKPPAAS
jgi:hypothetical protein